MKMEDILKAIKDLSNSQGFYGRLYNNLMEIKANDKETYNKIKTELESKQFTDILDLVMYIEC